MRPKACRLETTLFAFLALSLAAAPGRPSDGVIEINQAKALAGGVTPADAPGFPVTISLAGSYRLTSNLDVTVIGLPDSANTNAISIQGSPAKVSIDLNGFAILGPAICNGVTCLNTGTGIGIECFSATTIIRNGVVSGMGGYGLVLDNGVVSHVAALGNGLVGILSRAERSRSPRPAGTAPQASPAREPPSSTRARSTTSARVSRSPPESSRAARSPATTWEGFVSETRSRAPSPAAPTASRN